MEELLAVHQSVDDIITSLYPNDVGDCDAVNIRSSFSSQQSSHQVASDFLECFSLLNAVRQELQVMGEKIYCAQLNKLSSELIQPTVVGERISWCQKAEKHLRTIAENRVLLIYHLQQPFMANYLSMHYEYHRDLINLVEDLIDILNKTEAYLQLIENQAQDTVFQRADSGIMSIAQTMSELKKTLDNVFALKTIILKMIEGQHTEDVSTK